jgi:hypothetical protein
MSERYGSCGHNFGDPIDTTCERCLARAAARVRKRKSRGVLIGHDGPVPGLGGITYRQVFDLWTAIGDVESVLGHLERQASTMRSDSKLIPHDLIEVIMKVQRIKSNLRALAETYESVTRGAYPPLPRPRDDFSR